MLEARKVELSIHPGKITAWVSLVAVVAGVCFWFFTADASHAQTAENKSAIEKLVDDKQFKDRLYGPDYERRVLSILDREEEREAGE